MTLKKGITIVLLIFVAAAVGTIAVKSVTQNRVSVSPPNVSAVDQNSPRASGVEAGDDYDVVYYFMTSQRCVNCINFELFTREVLETSFSGQLKNKKLIWNMVNLDEPQNRHYIQDFQLFTKSIVLVHYHDGVRAGWKNLDLIWDLVGDKDSFQTYIAGEMTKFIGEQG